MKQALPINSVALETQQNTTIEGNMFKKKNVFAQEGPSEKTDDNLLKMLGINQKGAK